MANDNLTQAIETLYRVFARYKVPAELDAPEHREPEQLRRELTAMPLRQLDADSLGPYASWAMTTVDGSETYRHFLPRVLELALDHPGHMGLEPWQIVSKLDYGEWRKWPKLEQEAIEVFLYAAWEYTLNDEYDDPDWLVGLVAAGLNIERAVSVWQRHLSPNAMLKAAWLLGRAVVRDGSHHSLQGAYWEVTELEARRHIATWLLSPSLRDRLESARTKVAASSDEHSTLTRGIERRDQLVTAL